MILPIDELKNYQENGLIEARGALADLEDTVEEMVGKIYESRYLEKSREVKL